MNQESNFMSSVSPSNDEATEKKETSEKSFEELLDESLDTPVPTEQKSKIVKGTIIRVDKDDVFIDLGYKSEGIVGINEFRNKEGEPEVEIGSEVEVLMEMTGSSIPKVSKQKADLYKERRLIQETFENEEKINARVLNKVKGGLMCDIGTHSNFRAFLPGSQIDIRPVSNFDQFVGETFEVKIIQHDNNGIVISRRALLEEEREAKKKETLASLAEGQTVTGKIVKIIDRGVFVDIGGIEGYVPIGELCWGLTRHPGDVVKEGEEVNVKIIKIENERITLSIKHTTPDPWDNASEKYKSGTKVSGKVVSTTDFGAFVELEPGVDGLIHISELSWTQNFRHPKEVVDKNTVVEVVILDIQQEKRKISLSLKQIEKSPWELFKENNPGGRKVKGIIKNITELGLFVEVEKDLVGLVRPENISWNEKVNPTEIYDDSYLEKEIDVVVLNVIPKSKRIALGIKQISEDPWQNVVSKYKVNQSEITSKIIRANNSEIFVEIEEGIPGHYRKRDLALSRDEEISGKFKLGDEITGIVTGFDKNKRQVNLSQRKLEEKQEKDNLDNFVASQGESSTKLGDLLNEELKSLD